MNGTSFHDSVHSPTNLPPEIWTTFIIMNIICMQPIFQADTNARSVSSTISQRQHHRAHCQQQPNLDFTFQLGLFPKYSTFSAVALVLFYERTIFINFSFQIWVVNLDQFTILSHSQFEKILIKLKPLIVFLNQSNPSFCQNNLNRPEFYSKWNLLFW